MRELLEEAARLGASGEPAALVTVLRVAGSAPRKAGAKMVVRPDGSLVGSVGGGRVEHAAVALARDVARGLAPPTRWQRHLVRDLAMCCGGEMELWLEPVDPPRAVVLAEAARLLEAREAMALATELHPEGTLRLEPLPPAPEARRPRLLSDRFIEPLLPPPRLVLFGAGHIAHALAPIAASVGFQVTVCDDEDAYRTAERFPSADRLIESFDPQEIERTLGRFGPFDHLLIATRDHAIDQALLEALLPRAELGSLGMVGSRGKLGRFRRRLAAKGLGDEAAWSRLRSPVGLDIGAETPEEIAIAIVAELVRLRATP